MMVLVSHSSPFKMCFPIVCEIKWHDIFWPQQKCTSQHFIVPPKECLSRWNMNAFDLHQTVESYYVHFIDGGTEAHRKEGWCPKSHRAQNFSVLPILLPDFSPLKIFFFISTFPHDSFHSPHFLKNTNQIMSFPSHNPPKDSLRINFLILNIAYKILYDLPPAYVFSLI